MKKYLALIVSLVFVLGFAASALAVPAEIPAESQAVIAKGTTQLTIGGEMRFRGEWRNNIRDFNNSRNDQDSYYDMRLKLGIEAKLTPNTTGYVEFMSGNADNNDNVMWGDQSSPQGTGATGLYRVGNTKKGYVSILQMWIQHQGSGLLGVPAFVKVGHMPIKLGNGLFLDHSYYGDDAILLGVQPVKNMNIIAHTIKFREGNCSFGSSTCNYTSANAPLSNDSDAYGLIFSYDFDKKSSVSADITYVNHNNVAFSFDGTGNSGLDINLWNFALRGNAEFVPNWGLMADIEIQTGKLKRYWAGGTDAKFKGMAAWVGTYYKINPVKLYLDWAYGTGGNQGDTDIKTFVTTQGVDKHYTYVYEYRTAGAAGAQYGGLANTTFIRLGANADLAKGLNADLSIYWLSAVKDTFGWLPGVGGVSNMKTTQSKAIGWEVDWNISYMIDKNFKYWVEGGYLFAGDYWKTALSDGKSDAAWAVRQGISVAF